MVAVTIPAYEALAHDIKNLGIEEVFGLMSDDTALFVTTLDTIGVKFRAARHENNAVAMAEGYAAATGKLGIAIIGRGPATANSIHGVTYAQRTGSKVLVIFGDAPNTPAIPNGLGPDGKAFNAIAVLQGVGIRTFSATDSQTARYVLAQAVAAAQYGPTALLLPTNVQFGQIHSETTKPVAFQAPAQVRKPARAAATQAAIEMLKKSRRPLFLAGIGAHQAGARDVLVRLADHVGAALGSTLKAQGMFRGHPFDCGVVGSFSNAGGRRLIEQADCVVVFGASLNRRTTSNGTALPPDIPLIQVDTVRANIGRWSSVDVAVVADVKEVAEQLLAALPAREQSDMPLRSIEMRNWLAEFDIATEFEPLPTPRTMDPRSLGIELDRLLPQDRNLIYDAGNFLQIIPYISVLNPSHVKHSSDFSSVGMGFGTALGYACGTPDRTTVLIIGDGGFMMTMGELETAAREDIPLIIILMNDCAYGAELHYLKMRNMPVEKSKFPDIDYAPVAEAFGFQVATVRTLDELRALAPMLAKPEGPILLDCKINGEICASFVLENVALETRK